tara:strand:+ start:518 stop:2005 length:1488 start_codon:yes stop_codon:yes gene_type:complete
MTIEKKYETVIGLEVHAQLLTSSKMFCSCPTDYLDATPNSVVCPICLGLPGAMPSINKKAVEFVVMTGLALNSNIAEKTQFHRKNYPYPDLMKGYQISQYDIPIASDGWIDIEVEGNKKRIGITRIHLEEDVAKLSHRQDSKGQDYSLVDVNRSGIPLMETVSEPDIRSPEEARQYLIQLRAILQYLGVSTGNMEDGSFRCDANISIRPEGSSEFFTRVEIKNMNSLRSVYRALEYETVRQIEVVENGDRVVQETRGWSEERGVTVSQRTKENAHDYRYFPEPDLPPISIELAWQERVKEAVPELPSDKRNRFMSEYGLLEYDANILTTSQLTAGFFEEAINQRNTKSDQVQVKAKSIANWMIGDLFGLLNGAGIGIYDSKVSPTLLREFTDMVEVGTIRGPAAKTVLEQMFQTGQKPSQIADEQGLTQIEDDGLLESAVKKVIGDNPQAVQDYLGGKETAIRFLLGQVMKETRGRANPGSVTEFLINHLEGMEG